MLATTRMACPEPAMQIESGYLETLASVGSWRIEDGALVLAANGEEVLRYEEAQLLGSWQATGYLGGDAFTSLLSGTEITANFGADGVLGGSSGCNTYSSTYTIDGRSIELGQIAVTAMACAEPEGVMEQEQAYLTALQSAVSYRLTGPALELLDEQGRSVVSYRRS
jgi:heat shock protein HslJ